MSAGSSTVGRPQLRLGAALAALALVIALVVFPAPATAQEEGVCLLFDTELVSLDLSGGPFPMPLAADPANALGDSIDGFGFVDSDVTITLSSQRATDPGPSSTGQAFASNRFQEDGVGGPCGEDEVDPDVLDGEQFVVDSFFDVFFDITVTDVDARPGRDFAGAPDGAAVTLPDNGPANMESLAFVPFDKDAPNFGLIPPPEAAPYIGHFLIEIPLGGDINGNGENDKIKFTLATHSAGDENRTFVQLPDGTVIDGFDSAAFLEGAIVDESSDPPFQIGQLLPSGLPDPAVFGGPTTATSTLLNPVVSAPLDHYLFYDVKRTKHSPKFDKLAVHLADQFEEASFIIQKPEWFANPVSKNDEPIFDPFTHLTSYKIRRAPGQPQFEPIVGVGVVNQFHEEPLLVDVIKPDRLLVPGVKSLAEPPTDIPAQFPVDHFTCYKTEMAAGFEFPEGIEVTLADQFTEFKLFEVKKPTRLCTPAEKITADGVSVPIQHPDDHLMCYKLKAVKGEIKHDKLDGFWAGDQFGLHQFDSNKEVELCVPSRKILPLPGG